MTPPCDIEPQLVSAQDGPFFRLEYFASPEGCVFFEDGGDWTSESIGELRITNTSNQSITIRTSGGGSLRPISTFELEFPDRVSHWKRGPRIGRAPEQIEVVILPGMVWKSNTARILSPSAALAVKNKRPMGRGFLPVELEKPRIFSVTTGFYGKLKQNTAEHIVNIQLRSEIGVTYVPEDEEDPIDK